MPVPVFRSPLFHSTGGRQCPATCLPVARCALISRHWGKARWEAKKRRGKTVFSSLRRSMFDVRCSMFDVQPFPRRPRRPSAEPHPRKEGRRPPPCVCRCRQFPPPISGRGPGGGAPVWRPIFAMLHSIPKYKKEAASCYGSGFFFRRLGLEVLVLQPRVRSSTLFFLPAQGQAGSCLAVFLVSRINDQAEPLLFACPSISSIPPKHRMSRRPRKKKRQIARPHGKERSRIVPGTRRYIVTHPVLSNTVLRRRAEDNRWQQEHAFGD